MAQLVKNPSAMRETWVQSLDWEDPLEKGKVTHSSILAWRIHGLCSPWGCKESDTTEWLSLLEKGMAAHSSTFAWRILWTENMPGDSEVKASACNAGDLGSIPGLGRPPGEGNDNPLQYSCLENPMDRGAWWATVHGIAKSRTRLSDFTFTFNIRGNWDE